MVTAEGLEREGLVFHEVHKDAERLAKAAASTFKLTEFHPRLCVGFMRTSEALGAELNFYEGGEFQFPQVKKALFENTKEIRGIENSSVVSGEWNVGGFF